MTPPERPPSFGDISGDDLELALPTAGHAAPLGAGNREDLPPPPPPKRDLGKLVGGLAMLGAVGLLGWWFLGESSGPASSEAAAGPASDSLLPESAAALGKALESVVSGKPEGPGRRELGPGPKPDAETGFVVETEAPGEFVVLMVDSEPDGAQVLVDGGEFGETPITTNWTCKGDALSIEVRKAGRQPFFVSRPCRAGTMLHVSPKLAR